ncbi:MAG: PIG-L family deacetylase [Chloroflexota bacterium]|nr:PIG-L family deacetylase [Chloroflexota bacterium]
MTRPDGLLLVHAHPDDECFATGGLIARSIAEGRRVDLVVCTGGEEGEIHDPDLDPEEAKPRMREIRAAELDCSIDALRGTGPGELHVHPLGYRDSGMMDSEPNKHPEAFWQADMDGATGKLVAVIREAQPSVLVTYDANGNYGHPDHINAHRVAVAAFLAAADPSRYVGAGRAWAISKFYEIAFNRDRWLAVMGEMKERGISLPWDFDADPAADAGADALNPTNVEAARQVEEARGAAEEPPAFGTAEADITTFIDVSTWADAKRTAMTCHRTQRQDFGWLLDLPDDLAQRVLTPESFLLTRWPERGVSGGLRETSMFGDADAT